MSQPAMNENVRFHHFQVDTEDGMARVTAAYVLDENRDAELRLVRMAFAFCSPNDQFSKRTGRIKSAGRLNSQRYRCSVPFRVNKDEKFLPQLCSLLETQAKRNIPSKWSLNVLER